MWYGISRSVRQGKNSTSVDSISMVVLPLLDYSKHTMFMKKQKQAAATIKLFLYALNLQQENRKSVSSSKTKSVQKKETTTMNKTNF